MLNHTLPRIILASVPILCAAQFYVLRTYGEPYPALILPSFGGSAPREFHRRQDVVLLSGGKELHTVTIDEFLPHVQRSIRPRLVSRNLRPDDECSAETRAWLVELGRQLEPATDAVEIRWMHITKAGSEWVGTFPKP